MSIEQEISRRGIKEVLHFTPHHGLLGILHASFVKSRHRLPDEKELRHVYMPNAQYRKDVAWIDYVNLSVGQINHPFFGSSCRWKRDQDLWWSILSFDPIIMTHPGVYFATTNNIYSSVRRGLGTEGLIALFATNVVQYGPHVAERTRAHPPGFPTCSQAEVLYPSELSLEFLRKIYVKTGPDQDEVHAQLAVTDWPEIEVCVSPAHFGDNEAS